MQMRAFFVKSGWERSGNWLHASLMRIVDQIYPPQCLHCDAAIGQGDALCVGCFGQIRPITAPFCRILGLPFAVSLGPDAVSAEAIANPPAFGRARSAVLYNQIARALVSRLKYGDRPELARFCARLMAGAGQDLLGGDGLLVPVPLHRGRQFRRRYNQSSELGRALARLTGLACDPLLVARVRPTRQQVGLSADQRQRNVSGAFAVHPDLVARVAGRRVVLIDDVFTTGATLEALTRTLKRGGVNKIDCLTFARVVFGTELTI